MQTESLTGGKQAASFVVAGRIRSVAMPDPMLQLDQSLSAVI